MCVQWRRQKVLLGASPSHHSPLPLPSFPLSSPPLLPPPVSSPHLRSSYRPLAARGSGERLSPLKLSPAAKQFLVHFKHYFNRERTVRVSL